MATVNDINIIRKLTKQGKDPYIYENGTLINHLNIKDAKELNQAEEELSAIAIDDLNENPIQGQFDYDHLLSYHKKIFGDIYPFAGTPRSIQFPFTRILVTLVARGIVF